MRTAIRCQKQQAALLSTSSASRDEYRMYDRIGKREIVGFGINGTPCYSDRIDFPHPAIRFQEETPEIAALREKEKGAWNQWSIDEKKQLNRLSYRPTLSETIADNGEWRLVIALVLAGLTASKIAMMLVKEYLNPPLPKTFGEKWRTAMLDRRIDMNVAPITGLGSKWDYEKNQWR